MTCEEIRTIMDNWKALRARACKTWWAILAPERHRASFSGLLHSSDGFHLRPDVLDLFADGAKVLTCSSPAWSSPMQFLSGLTSKEVLEIQIQDLWLSKWFNRFTLSSSVPNWLYASQLMGSGYSARKTGPGFWWTPLSFWFRSGRLSLIFYRPWSQKVMNWAALQAFQHLKHFELFDWPDYWR